MEVRTHPHRRPAGAGSLPDRDRLGAEPFLLDCASAAREQLLDALDTLRQEHPELATVLVTHHLEELPASTTHAMLLRAGRCVASGPADAVLTTAQVSDCFGHPVRIARTDGRWTARAQRVTRG